jgi:hypothetical protein
MQAGIVALCAVVFASDGQASYPAPFWSFKKVTPNGKYVFIMLGEAERSPIGGFLEPLDAREIRLKYPESGLYPNDGSTVPLWVSQATCYNSELVLASDGVHMIFVSGRVRTPNETGLVFYAKGKSIRSYRIEELVDDWSKCKVIPSTKVVLWSEKKEFDDEKLEYSLITEDGNQLLFDVKTGAILSTRRSALWNRSVIWGIVVFVGFAGLVISFSWIRCKSRKQLEVEKQN